MPLPEFVFDRCEFPWNGYETFTDIEAVHEIGMIDLERVDWNCQWVQESFTRVLAWRQHLHNWEGRNGNERCSFRSCWLYLPFLHLSCRRVRGGTSRSVIPGSGGIFLMWLMVALHGRQLADALCKANWWKAKSCVAGFIPELQLVCINLRLVKRVHVTVSVSCCCWFVWRVGQPGPGGEPHWCRKWPFELSNFFEYHMAS